jgi:hypothetical protein
VKDTKFVTISIALLFIFSATLRPQMPPQPGRLAISSDPAAEVININGNDMPQHTNATFAVSPGNYTVSVAKASGQPDCAVITVSVSGGQTSTRTCAAGVWK